MKLNEVNSGIHKHKKVRRIGRGPGSGAARRRLGAVRASGLGRASKRCRSSRAVRRLLSGACRNEDSTIVLRC